MGQTIKILVDSDLESLIPGFLKNRDTDVRILKDAVANYDFKKIQSIGHMLKGVGGGYGFDLISEIGEEIEAAAAGNNINLIDDKIDELENYLKHLEIVYY